MGRSTAAAMREKEARGLALYVTGKNFTEIAAELGYFSKGEPNRAKAYEIITGYLKRESAASADEIRDKQGAEINALRAVLMPVALQNPIEWADEDKITGQVTVFKKLPGKQLDAIDRIVKLQEREAKLFGVDAPAKVEITGPPTYEEFSDTIDKYFAAYNQGQSDKAAELKEPADGA